jgi:hypothetical protein
MLTTKRQKQQYKEFLELQNMNKKKSSRDDNEDDADKSRDEVVKSKTKKIKLLKTEKHLQTKLEENKQTYRFAKARHPSKVNSEYEDEEEYNKQERNDYINAVVVVVLGIGVFIVLLVITVEVIEIVLNLF